ncbi:hypothetical protein [Gymnodinialimonas hymeniacidonis]|uniref:hypothetical protein n=1 Tax=Gymnodinialimonas hymeniacidonis TaxID=3126508 RepID=UPI0034C5EA6A
MTWLEAGYQLFPREFAVDAWCEAARNAALTAAEDPELRQLWLRHGGTWFVGVDALDNDAEGHVGLGPALGGAAYGAAVAATGVSLLHRAQVSITYPGYPRQDVDESETAHRFRLVRDAAHLDGLLPEGPQKRRHLREPHAWILGIALTEADADAAPLVVWEGSHRIIARAFSDAFEGIAPTDWGDVDVTDIYKDARAEVFETCKRFEVPLSIGESVLLHRHVIHGVAPWADGTKAALEGRAIAYFRPCFDDPEAWLSAP